jgi:glycolate oxidase FAD binding subunit
MVRQAALVSQLEAIVGREGMLGDPVAFAVDGLAPQAAVAPARYEQVAEVMRYAHAGGLAVIPRGAGQLMPIGNLPARYDIALDLRRLGRIVEHEPADMTVTCGAGATVAALNGRLAASRQFVPFSDDATDPASVGGLVATNHSHLRLRYGAPRDFTIGLRVVTAEGKLTRAGGRVVKNVAGYDLCKAYIGSLGTLGIIVEASFKVAPLPQASEVLQLELASASDACGLAAQVQRRGLSAWRIDLRRTAPAGGYVLSIGLAGTAAAVERSRREIGELARENGATPRASAAPPWTATDPAGERLTGVASVLPTQVAALVEAFEREAPDALVSAEPALGTVTAVRFGAEGVERIAGRLRTATAALGGTLLLKRCPLELKRAVDVFGEPPPSFALMRRLKEELDPKGVLSPGRFLGRL